MQMKYVRLRMFLRRFNREMVNYIRKGLKREYGCERRLKIDVRVGVKRKKNKLNLFLDFKKTLCYNIRKLMRRVVI